MLQQYANFLVHLFDLSTQKIKGLMNSSPLIWLQTAMPCYLTLSSCCWSCMGGHLWKEGLQLIKRLNLHEHSLVADRILCDQNRTVGGVLNVSITKNLLISAVMSSQRCEKYLQDERDRKKTDEKTRKRKHVLDEIEELKEKKTIKTEIDALFKSTDDISIKGEETGQLTLVARS